MLSLSDGLQLSCHKQKDNGSRADTSSISTGTSPTDAPAPWITTAATCTHSSGTDRGPCQALCIDANGKTCLAAPSAGADYDLTCLVLRCARPLRARLLVLLPSPACCLAVAASPRVLVTAHKPHGCPVSEREGQPDTRQDPANHLFQGFRYPNVSSERATTASAVISTRLPVRHLFPACKPLHLVFTLCKIDLRPRRPRTWCHLSLAASSDDHNQAYFPIGFTQLHACACCAWLHEYRRDVVTTAFDCLYRARIGRPSGTRTTLRLREDDTTTNSNRPLISPHSFKACSYGLDLLSILQRRRRNGFRCWARGV